MVFDLDNEPSSPIKPSSDQMLSISAYLSQLRQQGMIQAAPAMASPQFLADASRQLAAMDESPELTASPPRNAGPSSWRHDLHIPMHAPRRVVVRCAGRPSFVFGDLRPSATVGDVRELVWRRLMPAPTTQIVIEHWGRPLDPAQKLVDCALHDDCMLQARLVERRLVADRGLRRVRVVCTALHTRAIVVEPSCTCLDLKRSIEEVLIRGQHDWWDAEGHRTLVGTGPTLLAIEAALATEATGAVALGEELIIDSHQAHSLRGGKGGVSARRKASGESLMINEGALEDLEPRVELRTQHGDASPRAIGGPSNRVGMP